jgi:CheY-like chemotaxis protein
MPFSYLTRRWGKSERPAYDLRRWASNGQQAHVIPDELIAPGPRHILMLEDDVALAELLKVGLEMLRFKVTHVTNGAEGIKRIIDSDYDVILCDMVMPGFPDDMFYRAVERVRPELCKRFLFMTGHAGNAEIKSFIRSICGLVIWKPFPIHELHAAIEVVLR